jgi:hypothetical protein
MKISRGWLIFAFHQTFVFEKWLLSSFEGTISPRKRVSTRLFINDKETDGNSA